MDTEGDRRPDAPPLLVRRAALAGERDVAVLLRDVPLDEREVADLMRHHRVLVLSDLTLPLTAPPVAAVAFRLQWPARTAQLTGIGVGVCLRGRGFGRRLLTGALTWLRADGFEQVQACVTGGAAGASLLASAGFTADQDTDREHGRCRFVLLL